MRTRFSFFAVCIVAGCARDPSVTVTVPAAPTVIVARAATIATAAPVAAPFRDECVIDMSHGETTEYAVIALRDVAGSDAVEIGLRAPDAPFEVVTKDNGTEPFHVVVSGAALQDPDWVRGLSLVGVKAAELDRVEVHGIAIRGGWSLGLEIFFDKKGKKIGRASFSMRAANARTCLPMPSDKPS